MEVSVDLIEKKLYFYLNLPFFPDCEFTRVIIYGTFEQFVVLNVSLNVWRLKWAIKKTQMLSLTLKCREYI